MFKSQKVLLADGEPEFRFPHPRVWGVRVLPLDGPEIHKEKAQWERLELELTRVGPSSLGLIPRGLAGLSQGMGRKELTASSLPQAAVRQHPNPPRGRMWLWGSLCFPLRCLYLRASLARGENTALRLESLVCRLPDVRPGDISTLFSASFPLTGITADASVTRL